MNVAVEREDPRSMLSLTRALIQLRRSSAAHTDGSYRPIDQAPPDCFVYLRELDAVRLLVALNLSPAEQIVAAPDLGKGSICLSTHCDREGPVDLAALQLRPNEGCIVQLQALSS